MTKKSKELAVVQEFQFLSRWEGMDEETMAEIAEELESLGDDNGIPCRKIKVPSGGGLAYEVEGEDKDDVEYKKEIDAVILYNHLMNAYWPNPAGTGDEQGKIPLCSSLDGKNGLNIETGEIVSCDYCPLNKFGSATDANGANASGKACKNMRRVYLMMSGDPNLYLLTVPPTSLKDVKEQLNRALIKAKLPLWKQVVRFTLERVQNRANVTYSKVVLTPYGLLSPDAADASKTLRAEISRQYKGMAITVDDYNGPKQVGGGTSVTAPAIPPAPDSAASDAPPTPDDAAAPPDFEDAPPASGDDDGDLPF